MIKGVLYIYTVLEAYGQQSPKTLACEAPVAMPVVKSSVTVTSLVSSPVLLTQYCV